MKKVLFILAIVVASCTKEEVKPVVENAHAGEYPYITVGISGEAKEGGHAIHLTTKSNYPITFHVIYRKAKHEPNFQVVHVDMIDYENGSFWFPTKENKKYQYYGYGQLSFPQFFAYTEVIQLPK